MWVPWKLLHSILMKYLVCQAWMLTWCTIFREYLGEYLNLNGNKGSHALTLTSAVQCLLFGALNILAKDVSGICLDSRKKEELLGSDHKSQWITASRQSKRTVWSSSGGLKCIHQTFTFITAWNRNICLPELHNPKGCIPSLIHYQPCPPWYYQLPAARV